jgi:hypothetical protein
MKSFKRIIIFSLFYSILFVLGISAAQHYHLKTPEYRIEMTKDDFQKISIEGYFSYGVSGYPDLPSQVFRIALPPDIDINSIEINYSEGTKQSIGSFNIRELPPLETWVDGERIIGEKADIYSNDSYYPERVIEYLAVSQMRKWRIVSLKYNPFQYNPVTQDLLFTPDVDIEVKYSALSKTADLDADLADTVMDERANKIIFNFSEAENWYVSSREIPLPSQTHNYVIITTNAIQGASTKLPDFMTYLTNKGYSPLVVTENDYGSLTGQSPNGTAEKIRQWLIDNYLTMGIEFVLLIGNPDPDDPSSAGDSVGDVPMKMCWPRLDETSYQESPTDYFFADLTGNWDLDGDGYFGEYVGDRGTGGVDLLNEVYVGRVPVYSGVSDLDSVLEKTIQYGNESDIGWRSAALLPMSFSDSASDGAYLGEAMKSNYLTTGGFSSYTLYMQGSLCAAADSVFLSNEELIDGATKARWMNNPYGLVWWWGHGNQTGAYLGYTGCGLGSILSASDTPSLDDDYPSFVYQCSCLNGYPENSNNLGTALLYNGAITTTSASRVSWYAAGSWNTGLKYYCDNASIGYYYGLELVTNNSRASEALYDAKSVMGNSGSWWGGTSWMNLFDFNLYGDPAVNLSGQCNLPSTPSNPSPPDRATGIATNAVLDWDDCAGASYYNVRFGTTSPPPGVGDETSSSYDPGALSPNTTYYWQIAANNLCGETVGSIWSFTTQEGGIQYTLTIGSLSGGTTSPLPGDHLYDSGTDVEVNALPDSGYRFSHWTGDVPVGHDTDNPITITMDADKSITANFSVLSSDKVMTNVAASAFTGINSTVAYTRTGYSEYVFLTSGDSGHLTAPVTLPDGAKIKNIRLNFLDNTDSGHIQVHLVRLNHFTGSTTNVFSVTTDGLTSSSSVQWVVDSSASPANSYRQVQNGQVTWHIYAHFSATGSDLRIYSVQIEYLF